MERRGVKGDEKERTEIRKGKENKGEERKLLAAMQP